MKVSTPDPTHNPFEETYWVSCLRENLTSSSYGEGLETGRAPTQALRYRASPSPDNASSLGFTTSADWSAAGNVRKPTSSACFNSAASLFSRDIYETISNWALVVAESHHADCFCKRCAGPAARTTRG